jgi:hypothetical protein
MKNIETETAEENNSRTSRTRWQSRTVRRDDKAGQSDETTQQDSPTRRQSRTEHGLTDMATFCVILYKKKRIWIQNVTAHWEKLSLHWPTGQWSESFVR